MPTNQYVTYGTGSGANVQDPATYLANTARAEGQVSGTASSALSNTAWRQPSVVSTMLAQFICDNTGLDCLDDGDVAGLETKFRAALAATLVSSNPPIFTGQDTSTSASQITATLAPALGNYVAECIYIVKVNNTNTGPVQAVFNGLPTRPVITAQGAPLAGYDWFQGDVVAFSDNGSSLTLLNDRRVSNSVMINVANVTQLQAAVVAASKMIIASNVYVTIQCAAGTYAFTSITGPLYWDMPFGHRVKIVGAALTGAFPVASDIAGSTKSSCLTFLQGRFQTIFTSVGTDCAQIKSALGSMQNILFVGDGTTSGGHYGLKGGEWSNESAICVTQLQNCYFHGFGLANLRAEQGAYVQMNNVGSVYCTAEGYHFSHGSIGEVNVGNILSYYNNNCVDIYNTGALYIDSSSGTVDFGYSTSHNLTLASMGKFDATPSTGCRIVYAGGWGVYNYGQGQCNLPSTVTFTGNTTGDMFADVGAVNTAIGATVGTCSPTAGSGVSSRGAANYKT